MSIPAPTLSDDALLDAARRGDGRAFALLLRRNDERMRGLAYKLLADQTRMDRALRQAYLGAFGALELLKPGRDFGDWLYRRTYNACVDELRSAESADSTEPVSGAEGDAPFPVAEAVRRALSGLPDAQRITVVLVDGEGFSHKDAAEVLGVAPSTVGSRLQRARSALRAAVAEGLT